MAAADSEMSPVANGKGMPSRSQIGGRMKSMPLQHVAHNVSCAVIGSRQLRQTGGKMRSDNPDQARRSRARSRGRVDEETASSVLKSRDGMPYTTSNCRPKREAKDPTRMTDLPKIFDRDLLRDRRRRAAPRMQNHAFLLERFRDDVVERLALIQRTFSNALVIGAHGSAIGDALALCGLTRVVAMDTIPELLPPNEWAVVGDEEALPFAAATFDLIIAPLTLQFVNDLPGALLQISRSLQPDGLFIGGVLGGATLHELRLAWLEAEAEVTDGASPRVAPFADVRDLGGLLQRAGFALPVVDSDAVRVRYPSALALMQDLRGMGAGNVLCDRRRVPVTRRLLMRACEIYAEKFADADGRVPATFEMLVMTAWAPHESQQKPLKPGSATARLADALGTTEARLPDSTQTR